MEEIKKQIKNLMIENIQKVLTGESKSEKLLYCKPNDVIKYIESIGGEELSDEFETNGWQWDYWGYVKYDNKKYQLAGDGYYQDSITFGIIE